MRSLLERFEDKIERIPWSGCWLWTGADTRGGYGHIHEGGGVRHMRRAHQVSYELYKGPVPEGMWVLHTCDIRCCVNPEHLFLGTVQDNTDDKMQKGRHGFGIAQGQQRLSEVHANNYRLTWEAFKGEMSQRQLAKEIGISPQQLNRIINNKIWRKS